jgi:hypothetical protein
MSARQIIWTSCLYAVAFVFAVYFTRAGPRRVLGALFGCGIGALFLIEIIALGEEIKWWYWQFQFASCACFPVLLYIFCAVSGAPIFLITWRVGRRFGKWGLVVAIGGAGLIGPLRDFLIVRHFPQWGAFAPGAAPALAVAIAYVVFLTVGHGAMLFIAGPSKNDRLARQGPALK